MDNFFQLNQKSGYVLVVEDSNVQAKKLKFLLEDHGFEVNICVNGAEALAAIDLKKPMLIISDIVMPEMDGYELCTSLKANPATKDIPFILLTSLRDPLDIIRGLQSGADNFITKPYEDQYLLARIQYLLANRALRQSGGADMLIEVIFKGNRYAINSDKKQILDLLLSVYEAAVQRNDELILTQAKLEASNEELISANQELEAFAHTVSHDLRSPLHIINGYSRILIEEYAGSLDNTATNYLETIISSTMSMAQLVEDLLNFSRSAKAKLELNTVDLTKICREIFGRLKSREPDRHIECTVADGLLVYGDDGLMTIVMENLLSNAWKYTSKSDFPLVFVGVKHEGAEKVYFVRDNGAGFDPDKSYKMFNPFERLHTTQEFPGIGVGLATVRRIIERHGGRIWAQGRVGEGATFFFTIPEA
jgi:two-component system sensor histidine kinase/response regulator